MNLCVQNFTRISHRTMVPHRVSGDVGEGFRFATMSRGVWGSYPISDFSDGIGNRCAGVRLRLRVEMENPLAGGVWCFEMKRARVDHTQFLATVSACAASWNLGFHGGGFSAVNFVLSLLSVSEQI
jgi:hypothetical protein